MVLPGLHPAMEADTAGPARVPRAHTEATLVAPRVATSAVVIRVDLAVEVTSVGPAAVTLVVDMPAVAATARFSQHSRNLCPR